MSTQVIKMDFKNLKALYNAYMPFIKEGGLFVATRQLFKLSENLTLDIALLAEPERHRVKGQVVWLTPAGAQGGKPQGIGVKFVDDTGGKLRSKIETHLAGMLNSQISTDTM